MFNFVPTDNVPDPPFNEVGEVLGFGINILMGVGVSLSVIFIGIAGIHFLTAGSNPDNMDKAKKALTYSIVALVLSVAAVAIKYIFVNEILGVTAPGLSDSTPNF